MEKPDNTLLEMQQQMRELQEKLESQKIVNDRLLHNSCRQTINRLRLKASIPIIAGVAAIFTLPFLHDLGMSNVFLIYSLVMVLVCVAVTIFNNTRIPRMDKNLVSAAKDISKFRKTEANWLYIGIPLLVVWLGLFIWNLLHNTEMVSDGAIYYMLGGLAVGLIIGMAVGLKNRRDILSGADDLLTQIEELQN